MLADVFIPSECRKVACFRLRGEPKQGDVLDLDGADYRVVRRELRSNRAGQRSLWLVVELA